MKNKSLVTPVSGRELVHQLMSLAAVIAVIPAASADEITAVKSYVVPVSPHYRVQPLLSVGEQVPNTSDPSKIYQMIGIPDGLGAHKLPDGNTALFMNHELGNAVLSEPNLGGPLNRGAFISRWVLGKTGCVISGERAYDVVVDEANGLTLPAPQADNATPGFARFCSGSFSFREAGLDRPMYFTGEEGGGAGTFDGKGGMAAVVFDRELHTLPKLGHFPWENSLVRPAVGAQTVIMCMEDGPTTPDNQLYMYVGAKSKAAGASVLSRNGLDTGKLYAFVADAGSPASEIDFTAGSITGSWVEIPGADALTEVGLEAASDGAGAFGFIRIEDGAWSKKDKNLFHFVTTGNGAGNRLGRLYEVKFDRKNILGKATITLNVNADAVEAAGGDIAFAADNMDVSKDFLMINEDGHSDSRPKYASRAREGSIWRYDLKNSYAPVRIAELNPPGTAIAPGQTAPPAVPVPGTWETSGIIDASAFFGRDTWLTVVQAHSPTLAPAPNTVEDGQLLLILPNGGERGDHESCD
jgi:hypothetical protein